MKGKGAVKGDKGRQKGGRKEKRGSGNTPSEINFGYGALHTFASEITTKRRYTNVIIIIIIINCICTQEGSLIRYGGQYL